MTRTMRATRTTSRGRVVRRAVAAVVAAGVLVAGCSGEDAASEAPEPVADEDRGEDTGSVTSGLSDGGEAADEGGDAEAPAEDDAAGGGDVDEIVTFGGSGEAVGRQLARTASVILEVEDVQQAATRVTAAAQRAGGFVSDAQVRGGDFGSGLLTLRVPAERLDAALVDLGEIGVRVVESSITTEDLTEQLTDLDARISNLETLEAELQLLLADVRSGDPQATELLQVFERVNQVRGEIERLQAQRAAASDRVALATINVELLPRSTAPDEVEPEPEGTLARAWETTKDAFGNLADAAIWLVVTILPVGVVVLGIPALVIYGLYRLLQRRQHPPERVGATAPPPPAPGTGDREPADADV